MPYRILADVRPRLAVNAEFEPSFPDDAEFAVLINRPIPSETLVILLATRPTLVVTPMKSGGVPAVIHWRQASFVINSRIRQLLDQKSVGNHVFIPVDVRYRSDPHKCIGVYYLIASYPQVDCIDIDRTDFWGDNQKVLSTNEDATITVRLSAIAGHQLWRGVDPFHLDLFCSDHFHDYLIENGFEGIEFLQQCNGV